MRRGVIEAVVALSVLAIAIGIAAFVATRWDKPLIAGTTPADQPDGQPAGAPARAPNEDFTWLPAAMKACDDQALKEPGTLHFLIIPIVPDPAHADEFQKNSLNDIGNATVLAADDTLAGLKRSALSIATTSYVFSIRDEATQVVYKWDPSTGVKQFSTADSGAVKSFKMQLRAAGDSAETDWGTAFVRQTGNCYWVNAIPRGR